MEFGSGPLFESIVKTLFVTIVASVVQQASAQTIEQPVINVGDTWVYRDTIAKKPNPMTDMKSGKLVVTRVDNGKIETTVMSTTQEAPQTPQHRNADWSVSRTVNGKTEFSFYPLSFPLWIGKSWSDSKISVQREVTKETTYHQTITSKVISQEEIEVPAGKFLALKIEETKTVDVTEKIRPIDPASFEENNASSKEVTYPTKVLAIQTLWYVPEVKRWVKLYREEFFARQRQYLTVLESFSSAP